MTQAGDPRRESILGLARQLVGGIVQLVRLELTHGRQEIGQMLAETRGGLILIGVAVGLLMAALIALVAFVILAIAALTGLPGWLVALLVFIVLAVVAALLAYRGVRKIRIGPPEETIESVKEDIAWAKRLLRRG
ncbi:MAG TPA: phage holin family protein [Candidatus Dormibacteraeota bacterium]|nr:phage holin family protein [Candidatus Dormibacteraeota bacterium]